jgi:hypothetical protein
LKGDVRKIFLHNLEGVANISFIISRVGIIGTAPHRFLDIAFVEDIALLKYFYFTGDRDAFQILQQLFSEDRVIKNKISGRRFYWDVFFNRYGYSLGVSKKLIDALPTEMLRVIIHEISKADLIWVGDNDFDSSFGFAVILGLLGIPYVLTFKETRIYPNDFERFALDNAIRIIVPHEWYVELFKKKYGVDYSKKLLYGDIDWRSKYVYEIISKKNVQKLSEIDGKIHVCILSGRAIWDKNESRSRGRYYYVDIIKELLQAGFSVHLHTKFLIKSVNEPVFTQNNPYYDLKKQYPESFFIEKPINLLRPEGYLELRKYDLGLLTSGAAQEDKEFMEFEQYNIPNRYYEYQMAGVVPIAPRGTLKYMENNCDDVLFFDKAYEIFENITKYSKIVPKNFFCELLKVVTSTI